MSAAKVIGAIANISGAKIKKKVIKIHITLFVRGVLETLSFRFQRNFSKEEAEIKWALLALFVICIL